ncbi:MAG: ATP-binding protein [Candidatus Aenigmarchaeota archaeon]|nr:ATP-binding protein [Candidatus Aenigmarchaeota archaeon]
MDFNAKTGAKYAITGGPGCGKSSIIGELQKRGHYVVEEAAKPIIEQQMAIDGPNLPWKDRLAFQEDVLGMQKQMEAKIPANEIAFLDRGANDGLAYLWLDSIEPPLDFCRGINAHSYDGIFLLDELPLGAYKNTDYRTEDPQTARKISTLIHQAYRNAGYDVVRVPFMTVPDRAEYILKEVGVV